MANYRRNRAAGGSHFFMVNLRDRRADLLVIEIEARRGAVRAARARHPFHSDAWVVLPDHLHCLWTLPPDDCDFPIRWQMIKALFSRCVSPAEDRRASLVRKRESGIWQRRYWEHTIRDDHDYAAHMDYIHFDPVKHGLPPMPPTGRIRASPDASGWGCIRSIGRRRAAEWRPPVSGCDLRRGIT